MSNPSFAKDTQIAAQLVDELAQIKKRNGPQTTIHVKKTVHRRGKGAGIIAP